MTLESKIKQIEEEINDLHQSNLDRLFHVYKIHGETYHIPYVMNDVEKVKVLEEQKYNIMKDYYESELKKYKGD